MDAANRRAYTSRRALKAYAHSERLFPAEQAIFAALRPRLVGKRLLDIGVGGGRTTRLMLSLSDDYVAIDYSTTLLEATRRRFGLRSAYCCDARDMKPLADGTFDFALFSFNGIDYMPHEDRLTAMRDIKRVLRPGGLFLFSSHNRNVLAANGPAIAKLTHRSRMRALKGRVKEIMLKPRHWLMRRHEVYADEYAVVNDSALRYCLLTYYVAPDYQVKQLSTLGFSVEGIYDSFGRTVGNDDRSPWLHYLATKAA
jgi:SAM-dependent methyltransferase